MAITSQFFTLHQNFSYSLPNFSEYKSSKYQFSLDFIIKVTLIYYIALNEQYVKGENLVKSNKFFKDWSGEILRAFF